MGSRGTNSGRREPRIRAALTVGQLAMATVLLVSAGLLINSFVKLSAVERVRRRGGARLVRAGAPRDEGRSHGRLTE